MSKLVVSVCVIFHKSLGCQELVQCSTATWWQEARVAEYLKNNNLHYKCQSFGMFLLLGSCSPRAAGGLLFVYYEAFNFLEGILLIHCHLISLSNTK